MKKAIRIAGLGLLFLVLVALAGWAYLHYLLPTKNGVVETNAVKAQADIVTDKWGIPHIEAKNAHDAYFALGFSMAQDRLFQMDLQRRVSQANCRRY